MAWSKNRPFVFTFTVHRGAAFLMPDLPAVFRDRRLLALLISAPLALWLGFGAFSPDSALAVMTHAGYWIILALASAFGVALWRLRIPGGSPGWTFDRAKLLTAGVVLVAWVLLLVHDGFGFKILMDEAMLAGTAMAMHFERMPFVPMRAHDIQGAFELLGGQIDKRPLFQPFLVSLLHDFTGYRPENAFILNAGLTLLLLVLVYQGCRALAGRMAGLLAVVLLAGLPLLGQNATGGGFEVLNLVMIAATWLLAMRYVNRRDGRSLDALVMASVMLAMTRYESVLFILPVAGLVVAVWWRERAVRLGWFAAASPLLLVPFALHHKVFSARASSWELASQPGYEVPFSMAYVPDNLAHALVFFFDTTGEQSNSLGLAILGVLALPLFGLWVIKALPRWRRLAAPDLALVTLALGFAAHTALLMVYFWGRFDDPVIRRLSLPLNLCLVLAVVAVVRELPGTVRKWWVALALAGFGLFAYSLPAMARRDYSLDYYVARETAWRREFIAAHPERDYLVIDPNSIEWIIHQVSSTPVVRALESPEVIAFNRRNRVFSAVYVFQRYTIDPVDGQVRLPAEFDLGPAYALETVWERRFTPLTLSRISRVTGIDVGAAAPAVPADGLSAPTLTAEELEAARKAYLEKFVQQLP